MTERLPDSSRTAGNQPEDDLTVAYVTGELTGKARMEFEARLANEPDLAAQVGRFEELDLVGSVLAATQSGTNQATSGMPTTGDSQPRRVLPWIIALAAAGVAILFALRDSGIQCDARIVASLAAEDTATYAEALGMPSGTRIEGDGTRGAGDAAPAIPVDEFLASVARAEAVRSNDALATTSAPIPPTEAHVTLRFRADRECSAIVLMQAENGVTQRAYPSPAGQFIFNEVPNRFAPGATHTLPRPNATRNQLGLVHLHPGFAAGAKSMHLAIREAEIRNELLLELDQVLGQRPLAGVLAWLTERGFVVQTVSGASSK